jgi:DNA (cytosine-5)-methyltransferase 1
MSETNKLTVADFFCGAGGFSEGFNKSGFSIVFALDNWKHAVNTHHLNHPECKTTLMNILDLNTIELIDEIIPDTDIIIGSPPCISFSNSNKSGKADKSLGIKLIEQFLKIVLYKKTKKNSKLKFWIMENVPNSLKCVKDIYTSKELGLNEKLPNLIVNNKNILIASNYGSPQGRKRAICGDYIIPNITHTKEEKNLVLIDNILKSLGPPLNNQKIKIIDPSYKNIKLNKNNLSDHFYDSELPTDWCKKAKRLKQDHGYMGKMDFPDRTNRLCRTIMATESYCSRESIIFHKENTNKYRAPTIRELACLMGFPINYQFTGNSSNIKHKQIGNAVCVHLSKALAEEIKKSLNIDLICNLRTIENIKFNLNDLQYPLFSKYKPKPKKMNSKFHIHIPYLKINQLRVELDNLNSDFKKNEFIWSCLVHKGSGKNALKTSIDVDIIKILIENHNKFNEISIFIKDIEKKLYNSNLFQEKNCNIYNKLPHYSPEEILDLISTKIKNLEINHETIQFEFLDNKFNYKKKMNYPMEIIYGIYILNNVVNLVMRNNDMNN